MAGTITVFIHTSPFATQEPQYHNGATLTLAVPTDDTGALIQRAHRILQAIYRPGYRYQKAGIMLMDLTTKGVRQGALFEDVEEPAESDRRQRLMTALDEVNRKMGRGALRYALDHARPKWSMRTAHRSPAYTTRWAELPTVRAT